MKRLRFIGRTRSHAHKSHGPQRSGDDQARDFRGKIPADVIGEAKELPPGVEPDEEVCEIIRRTLAGGMDLAQDACLAADEVCKCFFKYQVRKMEEKEKETSETETDTDTDTETENSEFDFFFQYIFPCSTAVLCMYLSGASERSARACDRRYCDVFFVAAMAC